MFRRMTRSMSKTLNASSSLSSSKSSNVTSTKRKTGRKRVFKSTTSTKKRTKTQKAFRPPSDWRQTWDLVEELRKDRTAPVDKFGSEALPLRPPKVSQKTFEYQTLIALMLSSQTKDPIVGAAVKRLQTKLKPDGLTMKSVSKASEERIRELIYGVGFQNKKAVYIKKATAMIQNDFDSRVPDTFNELVKLPGVGPKMALIVLNCAFDKCVGVSIDTHLHRMLQQLNWVRKNSKNPEQTRTDLESWLPRECWPTMNLTWVGLGQEIQTESGKLIRKALNCSDPKAALRLLKRLFGGPGKLNRAAERAGIDL